MPYCAKFGNGLLDKYIVAGGSGKRPCVKVYQQVGGCGTTLRYQVRWCVRARARVAFTHHAPHHPPHSAHILTSLRAAYLPAPSTLYTPPSPSSHCSFPSADAERRAVGDAVNNGASAQHRHAGHGNHAPGGSVRGEPHEPAAAALSSARGHAETEVPLHNGDAVSALGTLPVAPRPLLCGPLGSWASGDPWRSGLLPACGAQRVGRRHVLTTQPCS